MERPARSTRIAQVLAILAIEMVKGQHTIANVTLAEIFFTSPGYINGLNYGNNMTRDYSFHTNFHGHNLQLKIIDFQLEDGDKNGDCLYDKVVIYDGYDESAAVLTELCGAISSGTVYDSSNNTVYVVFSSDSSNTFKGFNISIVSDGPIPSTTPLPTTETSTTMSSTISSSHTITTSKTSASSPITANYTGTESIHSSSFASSSFYPKTSSSSSAPSLSTLTSLISLTTPITTLKTHTTESSAFPNLSTTPSPLTSLLSTLLSTTSSYKTSDSFPSSSKVLTVSTEDTIDTTKISSNSSTVTTFSSTSSSPNMSTTLMTGTFSNQVSTTTGTRDEHIEDNGYIVWVIVVCCLVGFLLLAVCVVVIIRCLKKTNRAETKAVIHPIQSVHQSDIVAKSFFQNKSKQGTYVTTTAGNGPEG